MFNVVPAVVFLIVGVMLPAGAMANSGSERPDSEVPWFTIAHQTNPFLRDSAFVDTTLVDFQHYEFSKRESLFLATKGNVGHVTRLLEFDPLPDELFTLHPQPLYPGHNFKGEQLRFYRPKHVSTELFYVLGSEREQLFYARHSQRLRDDFVAGFKYQLISSPGYYSRMGAGNSNFNLTLDYVHPSKRYQAMGSFIINRPENEESGGLRDRQAFEQDEASDFVVLESARSRYRETAYNIHHLYQTGFYRTQMSDTIEEQRFFDLGRIHHDFSYRRKSFVFDEGAPPAGFYETPPFIEMSTYDSTQVNLLENRLSWSNFPAEGKPAELPLYFRVFLQHRMVDIRQPDYLDVLQEEGEGMGGSGLHEENFNQFEQGLELKTNPYRFLSFEGSGRMVLGGYNDEDFEIKAGMHVGGKRGMHRLSLNAFYTEREAPYFFSRFIGNYIYWDHDFDKMRIFNAGATYQNPFFSLEGNYYLLRNMVFMNAAALPEQNSSGFGVWTAGLSANLGYGILQSRHRVLYQYVETDHFERFPELVSNHSLFLDFYAFDQALYSNIGFDLYYNNPYRPMAYIPVVRQFYVQDEYTSDHTFLLDAYASAKIGRARVFVKLQNILPLFVDQPPVYQIPFYPLPENMFKFGISWMFFD